MAIGKLCGVDITTTGDISTPKLNVTDTNTSVVADTQYASYTEFTIDPPSNQPSNTKRRGIGSYVSIPNTSTNDVYEVMGVIGMAENYGSGSIYAMYAVNGWTYNYSDVSIDHLSGGWIGAESDAGDVGEFKVLELVGYGYCNTVTSMYGLKVGGLVSSTTSGVTNRYGVYIANLTGTATNDYGVYQAGSSQENYFAGNVGVKTNDPTTGLDVNDDVIRLRTSKTPTTASGIGNAGDICWDTDYVYVCVATDTWKRAALSTW